MNVRKSVYVVLVCTLLLTCTAWSQQQFNVYKYSTDGTPVPDVDKPDRNGDGQWPDPGDNSCWQVAAANMLGAAGYGTGANAQARATSIYTQITNDLGFNRCGQCEWAVNYWLYTYAKNPNSVEYTPANTYTDVTAVYKTLTAIDYNYLLTELKRCQYVAVGFDDPAHCMTLVGGNFDDGINPSKSIWHDSDRTNADIVVNVSDDVYTNNFPGQWNLVEYPASRANKYVTLCPGLNKPERAVSNYDVAYYRKTWGDNGLMPGFREAGLKANAYQDPAWEDDHTLLVGNEPIEDYYKIIYLLVDYKDRLIGRQENVQLIDDLGRFWQPKVEESIDGGQLLFTWKLDYQPAWEKILFPDIKYSTLAGDVKDWNIATICIPEPACLLLLSLGGAVVLRRRRSKLS